MASFISISSTPYLSPTSPQLKVLYSRLSLSLLIHNNYNAVNLYFNLFFSFFILKCLGARTRVLVLPAKCLSSEPRQETESKPEMKTSLSSSFSSSVSTYKWCAGIGGVGFLETAYLSYLKLTNSDAFCPIGGSNCGDVLNSDYAVVFGISLILTSLLVCML